MSELGQDQVSKLAKGGLFAGLSLRCRVQQELFDMLPSSQTGQYNLGVWWLQRVCGGPQLAFSSVLFGLACNELSNHDPASVACNPTGVWAIDMGLHSKR